MLNEEVLPIESLSRQGAYMARSCMEATAKDSMPLTYPIELKVAKPSFYQDLADSGIAFEAMIVARLDAESLDPATIVVIPETDRSEEEKSKKGQLTWFAYTDPQVRFIANPRIDSTFETLLSVHLGVPIIDAERVSEPDAIELGAVLPNGLRAMRFIEIKHHKTFKTSKAKPKDYFVSPLHSPFFTETDMEQRPFSGSHKEEDWIQLAHYYTHGQSLGLTDDSSLWAAIIGKEEMLIWANMSRMKFLTDAGTVNITRKQTPILDIYQSKFNLGQRVIVNAKLRDAGIDVLTGATPERKDKCESCVWRAVCDDQLAAHGGSGHITLLAGVTILSAPHYYRIGVSSIGALAALPLNQNVKNIKDDDIRQARVTLSNMVHKACGITSVDLERADIEVDFDCEYDQESGDRIHYMWGIRTTMYTDDDIITDVRTYDSYIPLEEFDAFFDTWNYFIKLRDLAETTNRTIKFYHYHNPEFTAMKKLARKFADNPNMPTEDEVEAFFMNSGQVIDMCKVMESQLIWPTETYGLKPLATYAGFSWRDKEPGGDESMLWYRAGCSDPDPQVRADNIDRLRKYNEDDVEAQLVLRNWIRANEDSFVSADDL